MSEDKECGFNNSYVDKYNDDNQYVSYNLASRARYTREEVTRSNGPFNELKDNEEQAEDLLAGMEDTANADEEDYKS